MRARKKKLGGGGELSLIFGMGVNVDVEKRESLGQYTFEELWFSHFVK